MTEKAALFSNVCPFMVKTPGQTVDPLLSEAIC